jgi:hypothetical protein
LPSGTATEKKKGLSLWQEPSEMEGESRRSKPAFLPVKREVGKRGAKRRFVESQLYFWASECVAKADK